MLWLCEADTGSASVWLFEWGTLRMSSAEEKKRLIQCGTENVIRSCVLCYWLYVINLVIHTYVITYSGRHNLLTYVFTCLLRLNYWNINLWRYVSEYIHICICVCVCVCVCIYIYIYIYIHPHEFLTYEVDVNMYVYVHMYMVSSSG
jgi:hypothetical protein